MTRLLLTFKSIGAVDIHVNKRSSGPARVWRAPARLLLALAASLLLALSASAAKKEVPPPVLEALGSDDVRMRVTAVVAVSKSEADNARLILETMLKKDESAPVRAAAVEGLARLGDPLSLPLLKQTAEADKAALVRKVARKAISALEAKVVRAYKKPEGMAVPIDVSDVRDLSGSGLPGLDKALQKRLVEELLKDSRREWQVSTAPLKKGYGLFAKVRSVKPFTQGGVHGLEVTCDITVVKLPGKALRLSLTATAAAGVKGKLRDGQKASIVNDGIEACAPALAKDFLDYAFQRPGP